MIGELQVSRRKVILFPLVLLELEKHDLKSYGFLSREIFLFLSCFKFLHSRFLLLNMDSL